MHYKNGNIMQQILTNHFNKPMEYTLSFLLWSSGLFLLLLASLLRRRATHKRPPGPPGWPIVGNIYDLGTLPHQTLYNLSFKYGPVVWLKLGSVNTMALQSAKAAAELFKNHDLAFCDRMCPNVLTAQNYHLGTLAFAHYGANWRELRRICTTELLQTKRVNETASLRRKCVDDMVRYIEEESAAAVARGESGEVNLGWFLFVMGFNVVSNVTLSKDLLDSHSEQGRDFYDAMSTIMELLGTPDAANFMPWLKWMDPQGLKKRMEPNMGQAMRIIRGFVEERIEEQQKTAQNKDQKVKKDFLDGLLEYKGDGKEGSCKISDRNMIIIVLEMFLAGSETTSSTLEWAMTELLRNPETMRKAKEELNHVVGPQRKVEESDMNQLPYLQVVLKEVLRLHPPVPMLLPRNTLEDTSFMGHLIPKGTHVFVNVWAIGRDADVWEDPLSFKPERFLGSNIEYKGHNYELLPFGSGRRICIGMSLAQKVLHLALASLIHYFDWELERNLTPETIDMSDSSGITARKLVPLKAIPIKCGAL